MRTNRQRMSSTNGKKVEEETAAAPVGAMLRRRRHIISILGVSSWMRAIYSACWLPRDGAPPLHGENARHAVLSNAAVSVDIELPFRTGEKPPFASLVVVQATDGYFEHLAVHVGSQPVVARAHVIRQSKRKVC